MKTKNTLITALALFLLSGSVLAAVSPEEAAKLGDSLTPLGAEKAGNADGSIPAWTGGIAKSAAKVDQHGYLGDPFANEQPQFVITAQNVEQHRDKLSEGQLALFKRYPESYKMPVYASRRTMSAPEPIYAAAKNSAQATSLVEGGNGLKGFKDSRYYAFPIPLNGLEVVWNHVTRYRGGNRKGVSVLAAPLANGAFTPVRVESQVAMPPVIAGLTPEKAENVLLFYKERTLSPARLAGNVLLVHDSLDQLKEPRMAWVYNAGQRRVRRAPQVAYDGPSGIDGLRTSDNVDMFNGAPDRYDWKLVGKRELYIPYNNYRLHSPELKYEDILKAGHPNQELARYELHRVWEVEATLKSGERHIYAKRRFFIDEDSWYIAVSEHYDGRGQLWRVGEAMLMHNYAAQSMEAAYQGLSDLISGRYLVSGLINEEKKYVEYGISAAMAEYTPAALRSAGVR
ncbi:MAG: DUF1329 domain-containing protein [Achromobacter sp.]|nr:DUF1329 domain-containing protein [Achromobacter sp.]